MSEHPHYDAFARMALGYVLEDDTWPLFVAWVATNGASAAAIAWTGEDPGLDDLRREWAKRSPDPALAALADLL